MSLNRLFGVKRLYLSVDLNTRVERYALGVYNEICMALGSLVGEG